MTVVAPIDDLYHIQRTHKKVDDYLCMLPSDIANLTSVSECIVLKTSGEIDVSLEM